MKDFSFVDETLDLNRAQSYRLSIQFSLNGFSFSILDLVRGKYILLNHSSFQDNQSYEQKGDKVREIIQSSSYLQADYKDITALIINPKSVLIPETFFNQQDLKTYFEFNHDLHELEELHFNHIKGIHAYSVYPLPNPVSNVLTEKYDKISFYHQSVPIIDYAMFSARSSKTHVLLSIYEGFMDIAILNQKKLFLYNSFFWSTPEDMLYFLLYAYKRLNLDVKENELYITDHFEKTRILEKLVKPYIHKVHFQKPPLAHTYSYTFLKDHTIAFINLFRLNLCV